MNIHIRKVKARVLELSKLLYCDRRALEPVQATRVDESSSAGGASPTLTLQTGDRWEEYDAIYRVSFTARIPAEWPGSGRMIALHLELSRPPTSEMLNTVEGLLFIDSQPCHALDRYHREIILTPEQIARGELPVIIRLWTGINKDAQVIGQMELRLIDEGAYHLHRRMALTLDAVENLSQQSPLFLALGNALEETCLLLDFGQSTAAAFYISCRQALDLLDERLELLYQPAGLNFEQAGWQPRVIATGHAHIDLAYLWRLRHSRLKAANTFSTALYHMDRYPYFIFTQSQPQLYQFVKEDQPELYRRIQQKVVAGQWEPEGAMWVEADVNITGAESLVRQFLFGQRFFRQEFGYTCKVLWLPDVFGYSAALPQLIKNSGAEYFITSKISWNDTNRMPADTFWWQGLDGTRVLTYFITTQNDDTRTDYTYNGDMRPGVLVRTWKNYRQKHINRETLLPYGYGDGGGGPTREMIEVAGWLDKVISPEIPAARTGKVADFMTRLEQQITGQPEVPRWVGELYLEYHRGTYTSQALTKRANRLAERDFHLVEWLSCVAHLLAGQAYPQSELNRAWQQVLTNQFHDILPGSAIGEVFADALESYRQVATVTGRAISQAQDAICRNLAVPDGSLVVFNPLSWPRDGLLEVDDDLYRRLNLPGQELQQGRALVNVRVVPSLGYRAFSPGEPQEKYAAGQITVTTSAMENEFYRLELNSRGQLTRLWDKKASREVLAPGERGNVFLLFEDKPVKYDAWDIEPFYEQKCQELDGLTGLEVIEQGPLRAGIRLEWRYIQRTVITQIIYLYAGQPRLDFVTVVDWQERQTLLKVAFPLDLRNGRATADIQFGNIERPTHRNTSWDQARFETCAHKWIDLSEGDYGVALLNDCKYGYDIQDNVMRLTLLKGGIYPDPQADRGLHEFTYSLLPHPHGWFEGGVQQAAYELNHPLLAASSSGSEAGQALPGSFSLARIEPGNLVIETVKKAEDSNGLVLRFYESANRSCSYQIQLGLAASRVVETNFLEEEVENSGQQAQLSVDGLTVQGFIRSYQIKTLVIYM